jgi:hypothetical protein
MRMHVSVTSTQEFNVGSWCATAPDFVIATLQEQLDAASAVWPELKGYRIKSARRMKADVA